MRRVELSLLVVGLIVVAGCTGLGGPGETNGVEADDDVQSTAPVQTDANGGEAVDGTTSAASDGGAESGVDDPDTPEGGSDGSDDGTTADGVGPAAGQFTPDGETPAWMADDGTVNETALVAAHSRAGEESVVAVEYGRGRDPVSQITADEYVVAGPSGVYSEVADRVTWAAGDLEMYALNRSDGTDYYLNYNTETQGSMDNESALRGFRSLLDRGEFAAVDRTTRDGQTVYELSVVGTRSSYYDYGAGNATVTADGRVVELQGGVATGESEAIHKRYRFDWSVESVPEPEWKPTVPRLQLAPGPDNASVVLENTGGATVPNGTELDAQVLFDGWFERSVTTASPLAPGESLWLAVENGTDGRQLVASRDRPSGPLVDLADHHVSLYSGIELSDRFVTFNADVDADEYE
jgi:hypothetical protein